MVTHGTVLITWQEMSHTCSSPRSPIGVDDGTSFATARRLRYSKYLKQHRTYSTSATMKAVRAPKKRTWFLRPTQFFIAGQWWSKWSINALHFRQYLERAGCNGLSECASGACTPPSVTSLVTEFSSAWWDSPVSRSVALSGSPSRLSSFHPSKGGISSGWGLIVLSCSPMHALDSTENATLPGSLWMTLHSVMKSQNHLHS